PDMEQYLFEEPGGCEQGGNMTQIVIFLVTFSHAAEPSEHRLQLPPCQIVIEPVYRPSVYAFKAYGIPWIKIFIAVDEHVHCRQHSVVFKCRVYCHDDVMMDDAGTVPLLQYVLIVDQDTIFRHIVIDMMEIIR